MYRQAIEEPGKSGRKTAKHKLYTLRNNQVSELLGPFHWKPLPTITDLPVENVFLYPIERANPANWPYTATRRTLTTDVQWPLRLIMLYNLPRCFFSWGKIRKPTGLSDSLPRNEDRCLYFAAFRRRPHTDTAHYTENDTVAAKTAHKKQPETDNLRNNG